MACGKLTLDAQFDSGVGLLFPDSGPEWHPSQFYMWDFSNPTHYLELDSYLLEKKIDAFLQHKTQYPDPKGTPKKCQSIHLCFVDVVDSLSWITRQTAQRCGVNATHIEGFKAFF